MKFDGTKDGRKRDADFWRGVLQDMDMAEQGCQEPSDGVQYLLAFMERNPAAYGTFRTMAECIVGGRSIETLWAEFERQLAQDRLKLDRPPGDEGVKLDLGSDLNLAAIHKYRSTEARN